MLENRTQESLSLDETGVSKLSSHLASEYQLANWRGERELVPGLLACVYVSAVWSFVSARKIDKAMESMREV